MHEGRGQQGMQGYIPAIEKHGPERTRVFGIFVSPFYVW